MHKIKSKLNSNIETDTLIFFNVLFLPNMNIYHKQKYIIVNKNKKLIITLVNYLMP